MGNARLHCIFSCILNCFGWINRILPSYLWVFGLPRFTFSVFSLLRVRIWDYVKLFWSEARAPCSVRSSTQGARATPTSVCCRGAAPARTASASRSSARSTSTASRGAATTSRSRPWPSRWRRPRYYLARCWSRRVYEDVFFGDMSGESHCIAEQFLLPAVLPDWRATRRSPRAGPKNRVFNYSVHKMSRQFHRELFLNLLNAHANCFASGDPSSEVICTYTETQRS